MPSTSPGRNRREFLSRASLALASAGVAGLPGRAAAAPQRPAAQAAGKAVLQRTLGRTGLTIPVVSMGVMNANNPDLVKQAYEAGVRLFDTAQSYQQGRNERMIGDVVAQLGVRDKVVIQTKIRFPRAGAGQIGPQLTAELGGCLERLQTRTSTSCSSTTPRWSR